MSVHLEPRAVKIDRSKQHFRSLLNQAVREPDRRDEIIAEIEAHFTQERAVLVADLDSFTASTVQHGIISLLILLQQVHQLFQPIVERHRGLLLKSQADTLFCLFETAEDAFRAALEIRGELGARGIHVDGGRPVTVAIGIGYGEVVNVADEDALGAEVNFAYKLGEDIGRSGDILLTASAWQRLPEGPCHFEERQVTFSGIPVAYYALRPDRGSSS